jgi:PAS domain S-box-containing protein
MILLTVSFWAGIGMLVEVAQRGGSMSDESRTEVRLRQEVEQHRLRVSELEAQIELGKQAEEALQERNAQLLLAQIIGGMGEFTWDIAAGAVTWSKGMHRLLKYSDDDEIDYDRINNEVHHPDDLERTTKWLQESIKAGVEKLTANEYRLICRDGEVIHVQTSGQLEFEGGKPVRLHGTCLDITKLKRTEEALRESEARFRILTEATSEGIALHDKGLLFDFNSQFATIFGYERDELIGMSVSDLASPDTRELVTHNTLTGIEEPYEADGLRKDGSTFPLELHVGAMPFQGRTVRVTSVRDLSAQENSRVEKAHLETQLLQSQKMEAVGRLAGGVAHDFNNLLTTILGNSELMARDLREGDSLLDDLAEITKAAERASALTRQLLAFSRKQMLQPRVLDLNATVKDIDRMLRRLIGEDIDIDTVLEPELGRVLADPGQIEQVLINLAVNARDAMPEGGRLSIETANVELDESDANSHPDGQSRPHVMVAVSDTGGGMEKEILSIVFEPFFTTKAKGKGTGLGLSTVYGIIKQSGGKIWVISEPGQGATFKFCLPRVEGAEAAPNDKDSTRDALGTETVLVVEDEEMVRSLVVTILKRRGYTVLVASDGEEARHVSEKHPDPIHLLLTDVVMPGASGKKVATALTADRPEVKVLFMSGYTDDTIVHHGVLDEGTNFITKPFTPTSLARKVREVLDA